MNRISDVYVFMLVYDLRVHDKSEVCGFAAADFQPEVCGFAAADFQPVRKGRRKQFSASSL
ncbi:MAG TPA: hypothetical protein VNO21_19710, partial [Polyangiaceae bacterium]|nr:hypothetical protein [Polyangiaceae bacterium]